MLRSMMAIALAAVAAIPALGLLTPAPASAAELVVHTGLPLLSTVVVADRPYYRRVAYVAPRYIARERDWRAHERYEAMRAHERYEHRDFRGDRDGRRDWR